MPKQIDLRGLTCPEPVLRTKKLLDDKSLSGTYVEALVDGEVNVNNLMRLARSLKLNCASEQHADHFKVTIRRSDDLSATNTLVQSSSVKAVQTEPEHSHAVVRTPSAVLRASAPETVSNEQSPTVGTVVFLDKDKFGEGEEEFSRTLTSIFLQTMFEAGHRPRAILLANTGVRLLAKDSSALKVLNDFRDAGVEVLACGLCVDFYGLKGDIPVDQITNMFAICEYMFAADRLITI